MTTLRPVFLLGPPRSGTRLLAWSLAQHRNFRVRDDDRTWGGVQALDSAMRWAGCGALPRCVSTHPDHAFRVAELLQTFPHARFVVVQREVGAVIDALVHGAVPDGSYYTEESACELWLRTVRACAAAERAFGSGVVHRIRLTELVDSPEPLLRRCLEFLDERFDAACARPFTGFAGLRRAPPPRAIADPPVRRLLQRACEAPAAGRAAPARSPIERLRAAVCAAAPPGATVLVVSRGDDALLELDGRVAWHFPRARDGRYAGWYPADADGAIRHLEQLRAQGAEYLVFPCTAFWWLSHYAKLRRHLERRYRLVASGDDSCLVFALHRRAARSASRVAARSGGERR